MNAFLGVQAMQPPDFALISRKGEGLVSASHRILSSRIDDLSDVTAADGTHNATHSKRTHDKLMTNS